MKTIDCLPSSDKKGAFGRFGNQLQRISQYGFGWYRDLQAQETLIKQLNGVLSNRYVLLRNMVLDGLDTPIPGILVGPAGVFVLNASATKGVFRARDDAWLTMNNRSKQFQTAQPNLLVGTLQMVRTVDDYLALKGIELPEVMGTRPDVQGLLFFSNPGTHVEAIRPVVRVLLSDAVKHFFTTLSQGRSFLNSQEVENVVQCITNPASFDTKAEKAPEDEMRSLVNISVPKAVPAAAEALTENLNTVSRKFSLTTGQWIFLGLMAFFEVLILLGFIIFVMMTSSI